MSSVDEIQRILDRRKDGMITFDEMCQSLIEACTE